jgi:transposase
LARKTLEKALWDEPELGPQKEAWGTGENEDPLEANASGSDASLSDASVEGDEGQPDAAMTDYLTSDDNENAALESGNTTALPRRGGSIDHLLPDAVFDACWEIIDRIESKYSSNRTTKEVARNSLLGIIGWCKGLWDWRRMPIEYGLWDTVIRRFHRWAEHGVYWILTDKGVVEFSKLPRCSGKTKELLSTARPENAPRQSRIIKNQVNMKNKVTVKVWRACWPVIQEKDEKFATSHGETLVKARLEGILYKLLTRCAWREVPVRYGAKSTLYKCYIRWVKIGVFEILVKFRMLEQSQLDPLPCRTIEQQKPAPPKRNLQRLAHPRSVPRPAGPSAYRLSKEVLKACLVTIRKTKK